MSKNFEVLCRIEQDRRPVSSAPEVDFPTILDAEIIQNSGPKNSAPHPEIMKLVHALFLSSSSAPHHVLFCGVSAAEGKRSGTLCTVIARTLAQEVSGEVCLVNAGSVGGSPLDALDLEKPVLESSKPAEQGCPAAQQVGRNFWFVSKAQLSSNGASIGSAEQVCSNLLRLCKQFSYVIVDAPPLGPDITASVLGRALNGVVLVVEANATRRVSARNAKEMLEAADVRLLGTVLNNRTFPIPERVYRRL